MSEQEMCCPDCGKEFVLAVNAELPASTDLTLTLQTEPGQFMRIDTIAGVLSSFRDMQIAVGESMGAKTDVYLAGLSHIGDTWAFTMRIANVPDSTPARMGEGE